MNNSHKETAPVRAVGKIEQAYNNALTLAMQEIPSFPCSENKRPTCLGGFKSASIDPKVIRDLWERNPGSHIGVPTGKISGLSVVDIDPKNDGNSWLNTNRNKLPQTRIHATRSGGVHYIFQHRDGLRSSAGKLAPGIDIRADGGYIIWWPATGLPVLNDAVPADWPDWLIQKLSPPPRPKFSPYIPINSRGSKYVRAALRNAEQIVASAPEGRRNQTLNCELWTLMRFVKSGELSTQQIANALVPAAIATGLSCREVLATLASVLRAKGAV